MRVLEPAFFGVDIVRVVVEREALLLAQPPLLGKHK
jgi:hypothetical protein